MKYYLSPPPSGPIARFVAGLVALCMLAGTVFFGLIALAIIVAVIAVVVAVAWVRARWFARGPKSAVTMATSASAKDSVIDAEYTVISRKRD